MQPDRIDKVLAGIDNCLADMPPVACWRCNQRMGEPSTCSVCKSEMGEYVHPPQNAKSVFWEEPPSCQLKLDLE